MSGKKFVKRPSLEVLERQKAVSELRLRGLSTTEIAKQLPELGITNKATGKPWPMSTVSHDLEEVAFDWRKQAKQSIADHKARILAELQAVKAAAWAENKLGVVLSAVEKECRILGLNSPEMLALVQATDQNIARSQATAKLHELAQKILKIKQEQESIPAITGSSNVVLEGKVSQTSTS